MPKLIDITGEKFGRLTVVGQSGRNKQGEILWLCQCICGKTISVRKQSLRSAHTRSCGCLRIETTIQKSEKHGHAARKKASKVYRAWCNMMTRCTNPKYDQYNDYGGRGIKVCKRWRKFENFNEDMGEPPTKDHSLDRINNNKGYYKGNCHWATTKEQMRNKRNNRLIEFNGKVQCIFAWAEEIGINKYTLHKRLNAYDWSIEKALTTPVRKQRKGRKM